MTIADQGVVLDRQRHASLLRRSIGSAPPAAYPVRASAVSYKSTRSAEIRVPLPCQSTRSAAMKYRPLDDSRITVSEIAFGSWLTFSSGAQKDAAIACVHRALDRGITLIDTANVYGRGAAEQVLGEAL